MRTMLMLELIVDSWQHYITLSHMTVSPVIYPIDMYISRLMQMYILQNHRNSLEYNSMQTVPA